MSEKEKGYFPSRKESLKEWSSLEILEAHIKRKIKEAYKTEREFYDPRDDEMMSEIYPEG